MSPSGRPRIFISAAEPSADLYGARLIEQFTALHPGARFVGLGGPKMAAVGCEIVYDLTRKAGMLTAVIGLAWLGFKLLRRCARCMDEEAFDAAVMIDSPTLNLPLARVAKRRGIKVLYYVAPQLWAWGGWRIGRLRRRADGVAAILPFEEAFFRQRGVNAHFVGHPLFEILSKTPPDPADIDCFQNLGSPRIALLPGSRRHVVEEVLPGQLEIARAIRERKPGAVFLLSAANDTVRPVIDRRMAREPALRHALHIVPGSPGAALAAADLVLIASGTSTLEATFYRVPMIVMYNASRWFYQVLGRWLIKSPYLSLPNILAGRPIVPEFMPYYTSTRPIADTALRILDDSAVRAKMQWDLADLSSALGSSEASVLTARLLGGMVVNR